MHCGLVPLQGDARVSTVGLKWDLNDEVMSFNAGGLISTSNQFIEDKVVIRTDVPLLFTASPPMPL
jgi:thiamine pyrophosphokinase